MPPPDRLLCPAEAMPEVSAEPMPPGGISTSALHDTLVAGFGKTGEDLFTWLAVDHPVWARGVANRLTAVQAECKKSELAGTQPPS